MIVTLLIDQCCGTYVVGVYCVNFITIVGSVWEMFFYLVHLIVVVESTFVGTHSVNSVIYLYWGMRITPSS